MEKSVKKESHRGGTANIGCNLDPSPRLTPEYVCMGQMPNSPPKPKITELGFHNMEFEFSQVNCPLNEKFTVFFGET